ncbi:MAG: hypothetical protein U9Q98_00455 [Bacteroidota bacterium]|nr:hypothetical protein [Bacteroidota bacterium]
MKSKKFIKEKLEQLFAQFNDIKIQYEYRANTYSHIIEVTPLEFFKEDERYLILEAELEEEFESLFPNENIVFISEGSLSEIKSAEFELGGKSITFHNEVTNIDFIVVEFSESVDFQYSNNYALAA